MSATNVSECLNGTRIKDSSNSKIKSHSQCDNISFNLRTHFSMLRANFSQTNFESVVAQFIRIRKWNAAKIGNTPKKVTKSYRFVQFKKKVMKWAGGNLPENLNKSNCWYRQQWWAKIWPSLFPTQWRSRVQWERTSESNVLEMTATAKKCGIHFQVQSQRVNRFKVHRAHWIKANSSSVYVPIRMQKKEPNWFDKALHKSYRLCWTLSDCIWVVRNFFVLKYPIRN